MTFCQSKGDIPYFETSAKEAINIDQAFEGALCSPSLTEAAPHADLTSYRTERPGSGRVGRV